MIDYAPEYGHGFMLTGGRFTTIDVPGAAPAQTLARGINAVGQIVGGYIDTARHYHGFLLTNGRFTTIDIPNARPLPTGINTVGQIVGNGTTYSGQGLAFLMTGGRVATFDFGHIFPGSQVDGYISGINDAGQIVGYYSAYDLRNYVKGTLAPHYIHGFLLVGGP